MSSGSVLQGCLAVSVAIVVAAANASIAQASNETVLYSFTGSVTGGADGANPGFGSLVSDSSGALYGTTVYGGTFGTTGGGTVYKLTAQGRRWTRTVLHSFSSAPDGLNPFAGVIFGSDGALYGTTVFGGNSGLLDLLFSEVAQAQCADQDHRSALPS
jgi:uncharacterized repeat protein (TIGR03803 family)